MRGLLYRVAPLSNLTRVTSFFRHLVFCTVLALWLPLSSHAQGAEQCITSIVQLKDLLADQTFALNWEETTMDDGKPLVVTLLEKNGALSVTFIKTTKGLWADISGVVCKTDKGLEIRFTHEQIHFGPAASWVLRYALGNGGKFTLSQIDAKQLQVTTTGWSGIFVPLKD